MEAEDKLSAGEEETEGTTSRRHTTKRQRITKAKAKSCKKGGRKILISKIRDDEAGYGVSKDKEVFSDTRRRKRNNRKQSQSKVEPSEKEGRWTPEEHARLLKALELYGNCWPSVETYVGTRNRAQIRSHVQKYFIKVRKNVIQELVRTDQIKSKIFVVTREYRNCTMDPAAPRALIQSETYEVLPPPGTQTSLAACEPLSGTVTIRVPEDSNVSIQEEHSFDGFVPEDEVGCTNEIGAGVEIATLGLEREIADKYYREELPQVVDWGVGEADNLLGQ